MEPDNTQNVIEHKIRWNQITWYSQVLALVLGIAIFALGYQVGSHKYSLLEESNRKLAASLDEETQKLITVSDNVQELQQTRNKLLTTTGLSGACEKGIETLPDGLYETVETKLAEKYPDYLFDGKKPFSLDRYSGRSFGLGLFNCILDNNSIVASFIYEDKSEAEFPPVRFKLVQFDFAGNLIQEIPKDVGIKYQSGYTSGVMTDGNLIFTARTIDPCYDALHTYRVDLRTGEYTEEMDGGDDKECWIRLNAAGGV